MSLSSVIYYIDPVTGREEELVTIQSTEFRIWVDYDEIPDSYRAVAKYSAKVSTRYVTGYITTAEYTGEVSRTVSGNSIYTAYFLGREIKPEPTPAVAQPKPNPEPEAPAPTSEASLPETQERGTPLWMLILIGAILAALLAGGVAYWFLRHNVRIYMYKDGNRVLVAKDRIGGKEPVIDVSTLDGDCFFIAINRQAAKKLDGCTVGVRYGEILLKHQVAYEGDTYNIEADVFARTIQAVH
jgi:hypothetical protein